MKSFRKATGMLWAVLIFLGHWTVKAQVAPVDELTELAYRTRVKQVNQFIKRFNNTDAQFKGLFEEFKSQPPVQLDAVRYLIKPEVDAAIKEAFLEVVERDEPELVFGDQQWFARVETLVQFEGNLDSLKLSLQVIPDIEDSFKWIITGAQADFLSLPSPKKKKFINPVSHETRFIDLYAVMKDRGNARAYTRPEFDGDDLTMLVQAIDAGALNFAGATSLEFYFMQVDGWIIGIHDVNDRGAAGGWMIHELIPAQNTEKESFKKNRLFIID